MIKKAILLTFFLAFGPAVFAQTNEEGLAAVEAGDFATAFEIWTILAGQGDARAMSNLGVMYDRGNGVAEDDAEAFRLFAIAARENWAPAQYNLGKLYATGASVPENPFLGYVWFLIAEKNGIERAAEAARYIESIMGQDEQERAKDFMRVCVSSNFSKCE